MAFGLKSDLGSSIRGTGSARSTAATDLAATALPSGRQGALPSSPRSSRPWLDSLGIGILIVVALFFWSDLVQTPQVLIDEAIYFEAAEAIADGGSPYDVRLFVYTPPLAVLLDGLLDSIGPTSTLRLLRLANVASLASLTWISLGFLRTSYRLHLGLGVLVITLSPMVKSALEHGNLNPIFAAAALIGLWSASRRPIVAGVILGIAIGFKPLAVPAVAALVAAGPKLRWAGFTAAISTMVTLLFGLDYLPGLLTKAAGMPEIHFNISLHRVLYCFGLEVSPMALMFFLTVAAAGLSRWFRADGEEVMLLGTSLSLLSIPVGSPYTYLLILPVLTIGISEYYSSKRPRSLVFGCLVLLAVVSVHSTYGLGKMPDASLLLQGSLAVFPVMSPLVLALWVLEGRRRQRLSIDQSTLHR